MMMETGYQTSTTPAQARPLRRFLLIALLGLLVGMGLVLWGLSRSPTAREYLLGSDAPAGTEPPIVSVSPPPPSGVMRPTLTPTPQPADDRIAILEAQVAQLSRTTAVQSGGSERAEGLLLAFAARRALDRGLALGYVEGQLSSHFGTRQPRAVTMIIAAARQPVTLDQLKSDLDALAPKLTGSNPDEGWWHSITRSLSGLFIVRDAGAPSTLPAERLSRASDAISLGRVDQALAEVARLPNRNVATEWMAKAKRHIEAYRALDLLEAAAIIGPGETVQPPAIALPEPDAPAPTATQKEAPQGDSL
jgi:hypothetical protein